MGNEFSHRNLKEVQTLDWVQIGFICFLGAMSPGPSLAFMVSVAVTRARYHGVVAGIGHGIGISLWAFITALGIAQILMTVSVLMSIFQLAGIFLLIYIGVQTLRHKYEFGLHVETDSDIQSRIFLKSGVEGFLLALFNPKIAVFFIAIFSQFVRSDTTFLDTFLIGVLAGLIDAAWYSTVAVLLTRRSLVSRFQARESLVRGGSGALLIGIAFILGLKAFLDLT